MLKRNRSRTTTALLLTLAALGPLAAPAHATFAGHNGRIALAWLDDNQGAHGALDYAIDTVPWLHGSMGRDVQSCPSLGSSSSGNCPVFSHPKFSPDGHQLIFTRASDAFLTDPTARTALFRGAPDGTGLVSIADPVNNLFDASFAPSGNSLIFARSATYSPGTVTPSPGEIVTSDLSGGGVQVLTTLAGSDPAISPSGRTVLFVHDGSIWIVGIHGENPRLLISDAAMPDWAPNGRAIVYVAGSDYSAGGRHTLYVARGDGTHRKRIFGGFPHKRLRPVTYVDDPVFSPDGKQIAFSTTNYNVIANNATDPYIMRLPATGGRIRVLWTTPPLDGGGTDLGMTWQPLP